jgi:DNA repair exonuclease SbcCD nuclease subunit
MNKWQEVFRIAKERNADFVIHAGDLFDVADPEVEVILDVMKVIDRRMYLVVGNHDWKGSH